MYLWFKIRVVWVDFLAFEIFIFIDFVVPNLYLFTSEIHTLKKGDSIKNSHLYIYLV